MDKNKFITELIEIRFKNAETALHLQTAETNRRLDLLNGEAERLRQMQMTYLPREVYDTQYTTLSDKIDNLQKIVYIVVGIGLVLQLILRFIK